MSPLIVHIIAPPLDANAGGLERAIGRRATAFAAAGCEVVIYLAWSDSRHLAGVEIVRLAGERARLEEPLTGGQLFPQMAAATARGWLASLVLRNAVEERLTRPGKHVLLSFAVQPAGLAAQHLALALDLPHIATIRGSDFSQDVHGAAGLAALEQLARRAHRIVTTNDEQASFIRRVFGRDDVRRIHNALPALPALRATPRPDGRVRLFADCGWSLKKGSALLLDAVEQLLGADARLEATLAGSQPFDDPVPRAYWTQRRERARSAFAERIVFADFLDQDALDKELQSADLYCSATFAEGCSHARLAALASGIPVVSTRTGELLDLAGDAAHVRLARPASLADFVRVLESAVADLRAGRMEVRAEVVEAWRRYFSPQRENDEWMSVLGAL